MTLSTNVNIMEYIVSNVLKQILSILDKHMKTFIEDGFFINGILKIIIIQTAIFKMLGISMVEIVLEFIQ